MKSFVNLFLAAFVLLTVVQANAKVEWNEPEVVPEKLVRPGRRVLRFSGSTSPKAQLRIRKDSLKLYLANGKTRISKIPQKNVIQFPVVADGNGDFTFDLYLPTVAVEIPLEVKSDNKWVPYTLNFRVPDAGAANDFQAIEESFTDREQEVQSLDIDENYYTRKNDQGMLIRDRGGKAGYQDSNIHAWGGLGISYFSTTVESRSVTNVSNHNRSGSTVAIPAFRLGADWTYSEKLKLMGSLRSTSGSTDSIGDDFTQGRDFKWFEVQGNAVYFFDFMKVKSTRLGLDMGFQLQSLPFFRERPNFRNESYFDNVTYNLHLGVFYEKTGSPMWNYEVYARYLYPISAGNSFKIESTFPMMFEFGGGIKRPLTQGLALGVFGQLDYFSMDVSYINQTLIESSLNLTLLTVDVRLIANF